ncbi:signal peptidase II [Candidatus Poribacteria bacterium]|nr:signal peptidase II [Candidatus Poribacteria bacterium]
MSVSITDTSKDIAKSSLPMVITAVLVIALDQVTKEIIRNTVAIRGTIQVIKGFLQITYAENTGAAFGMFRGKNNVFIIIGIIAIIFILLYYRQFRSSTWMRISLGFLLGGAVGNMIDRIVFHYVTDFIRVRWWFLRLRWWPSFNVADAAVLIGASMLIIGMFIESKNIPQTEKG